MSLPRHRFRECCVRRDVSPAHRILFQFSPEAPLGLGRPSLPILKEPGDAFRKQSNDSTHERDEENSK